MKTTCNKCGQCCKGSMGPFVFPSDVIRISNKLNIAPQNFLDKYCNKNCISILKKDVEIYSVKLNNSSCMFLNNENLCSIYDIRPYQCVEAPYNFLSRYGLWNHMRCLDYEYLSHCNSDESDSIIFTEIINNGYKNL